MKLHRPRGTRDFTPKETAKRRYMLPFTIPDKPRSRLQKYRTTGSGLAVLKHHAKNGEDENHLLNEAEMTT